MYIDSTFIFCPACGNMVSLSWGWCPYHATREQLHLEDQNGDGKLKDEFTRDKRVKLNTIASILNSPLDNSDDSTEKKFRLMLHY
jgi:hypothetical protein